MLFHSDISVSPFTAHECVELMELLNEHSVDKSSGRIARNHVTAGVMLRLGMQFGLKTRCIHTEHHSTADWQRTGCHNARYYVGEISSERGQRNLIDLALISSSCRRFCSVFKWFWVKITVVVSPFLNLPHIPSRSSYVPLYNMQDRQEYDV